jgi:hypothetical protein
MNCAFFNIVDDSFMEVSSNSSAYLGVRKCGNTSCLFALQPLFLVMTVSDSRATTALEWRPAPPLATPSRADRGFLTHP